MSLFEPLLIVGLCRDTDSSNEKSEKPYKYKHLE